jgi:hypothetical protein
MEPFAADHVWIVLHEAAGSSREHQAMTPIQVNRAGERPKRWVGLHDQALHRPKSLMLSAAELAQKLIELGLLCFSLESSA